MRKILPVFFLALASVATAPAYADKAPIYTKSFNNLGAGGYDVVSYFKDGSPVKGDKAYSAEYMGADFIFASQANLEAFKANPEEYVPQYGGYCAWAMADGKFFKGDPKQWTVLDGKLYLNYSDKIQAKWKADPEGFIQSADAKWPDILNR
ncbi:YHS domain-containing (seleno)protein [Hirschia litorea]|uniref:YHS domain-containing (Seleno)protein n=1 Tax=Hirschia litorea TaxID=1199156 RepID=A0ABW2IJW4_9PROT